VDKDRLRELIERDPEMLDKIADAWRPAFKAMSEALAAASAVITKFSEELAKYPEWAAYFESLEADEPEIVE